jgi:hypothetical protein
MPELRHVAIGEVVCEDVMVYIFRAIKRAPSLSTLQLPRAHSAGYTARLTALLPPILPDTLVSLWIADLYNVYTSIQAWLRHPDTCYRMPST